jgi:hypothetical protein
MALPGQWGQRNQMVRPGPEGDDVEIKMVLFHEPPPRCGNTQLYWWHEDGDIPS